MARNVELCLDTGDSPPVWDRPRRYSRKARAIISLEVKRLLACDAICETEMSGWNMCPHVVMQNGKARVTWDYRKANKVCKSGKHQLPRQEELVDELADAVWLTVLDLAAAYHQIRIRRCDRHKTAFQWNGQTYMWNVMPFGIMGAPHVQQMHMDWVMKHVPNTRTYLDDMPSWTTTDDDVGHVRHLAVVFRRLAETGHTLKLSKCLFGRKKDVPFLGHVWQGEGVIGLDPDKVKEVRDMRNPTNPTEVRRFNGLAGYYRKFIKDLAKI
jgi:hypothetical protein